jgi:hypothetical protein
MGSNSQCMAYFMVIENPNRRNRDKQRPSAAGEAAS